MSVKIMNNVWQYSKQKGSTLLLLLAIADNASDSGYAFPGIDYLARKTRLSPRHIIRLVQQIEKTDELTVIREKSHNEYVVNVWPPDFGGIRRCERCGALDVPEIGAGLHRHHKIPVPKGGTNKPENIEILCKDCHELHHKMEKIKSKKQGDKMSRDKMSRDKIAPLGDSGVTSEVTPESPEPSITVNEPPLGGKPPNIPSDDDFSDLFPEQLPENNSGQMSSPLLSDNEKAHLLTFGFLPTNPPPTDDAYQKQQIIEDVWIKPISREIKMGLVYFTEAMWVKGMKVRIPKDKTTQGKWASGVKDHLDNYSLDNLKRLYPLAIQHAKDRDWDIYSPHSLTTALAKVYSHSEQSIPLNSYKDDPQYQFFAAIEEEKNGRSR